MLLFRPHRTFDDITTWSFQGQFFCGTTDDAFLAIAQEFETWRTALALQSTAHTASHVPLSEAWWACMITNAMRNFDLAANKHQMFADNIPTDVRTLPLMQQEPV